METLGQRIKMILEQHQITQKQFASTLGISANYANLLVNDKKQKISNTLAKLIEESYGFSAQWVMDGSGEKYTVYFLTNIKAELFEKLKQMSDEEAKVILAFIETLESTNKKFPIK